MAPSGPCRTCGQMGHITARSSKCLKHDEYDKRKADKKGKVTSKHVKKPTDKADKAKEVEEDEERKDTSKHGKKKPTVKADKAKEVEEYEEPKIKWKRSKAKMILMQDILDGKVPLHATDEDGKRTTDLHELYYSRVEFTEYHYSKFQSRLYSLRKTIKNDKNRQALDQEAFDNYRLNHPELAQFSHKGYIQWQGSLSQQLCQQDLKEKKHETMSRLDFYCSRPEYYNEFPLDAFRDKVKQEIRTAKYFHTLQVKGKDPRKKNSSPIKLTRY